MFSSSQVGEVKAYRGTALPVLVMEYGRPWKILCLAQLLVFWAAGLSGWELSRMARQGHTPQGILQHTLPSTVQKEIVGKSCLKL